MTTPASIAWHASVEIATSSVAAPSTPVSELAAASGRLSARVQAIVALDSQVSGAVEPLLRRLGAVTDPAGLPDAWRAIADRLSAFHGGDSTLGFG
jgi:hypothetical protein